MWLSRGLAAVGNRNYVDACETVTRPNGLGSRTSPGRNCLRTRWCRSKSVAQGRRAAQGKDPREGRNPSDRITTAAGWITYDGLRKPVKGPLPTPAAGGDPTEHRVVRDPRGPDQLRGVAHRPLHLRFAERPSLETPALCLGNVTQPTPFDCIEQLPKARRGGVGRWGVTYLET